MSRKTAGPRNQSEASLKAYEMKLQAAGLKPPGCSAPTATGKAVAPVSPTGVHGRHDRILRRPEVEARTGLSRSTIYSMMAEGEFPRPIRLGKRAVGWTETAIASWLAGREQAEA